MREFTKKLTQYLEENEWIFSVEDGVENNPEDDDVIYLTCEGDYHNAIFMVIFVQEDDFYITSTLFSADGMDKYQAFLELVNEHNDQAVYTTFFITKDDEKKGFFVRCSYARLYDENSTPYDVIAVLNMLLDASSDLYMKIMKELV